MTCIRCREQTAVDGEGLCGHCHWAIRAEIEAGFWELRNYLRKWAGYSQWCESHGCDA